MLLVGTIITERYELLRPLGEGASAEVWLAKDLIRGGAFVALKVAKRQKTLPEKRLIKAYFAHEREFLCEHKGSILPTYIGEGVWNDRPYTAMSYCEGQTLTQYMQANPVRTIADAVVLFLKLLEAVDTLHNEGLIHRDLKPGNVILQPKGALGFSVAILDLLASRKGRRGADLAAFEHCAGYTSPEQLQGEVPTAKQDVFSLAIILYELLAPENRHPTGVLLHEPVRRLWQKDVEIIPIQAVRPEVSRRLAYVVHRGFHPDPFRRYDSVTVFASALRESLSEAN